MFEPHTRQQCAAVLGVPANASADEIRRAWRMWAQALHPDHGGDAAEFHRVHSAYLALMSCVGEGPAAADDPAVADTPDAMGELTPAPRPPLRAVLCRPHHPAVLVALAGAAVAVAIATGRLGLPVAAVAGCGVLNGIAVIAFARSVLQPPADAGHRVAVASLTWVALTAMQLIGSTLAGASLLPVLPVLAVPLVAFTSIVLFPGLGRRTQWRG